MSAGNVARTLRAPGRLVINPTDLTLAFPYGGTEVGKTRLVVLRNLSPSLFRVTSEGLGGEPTDILEGPPHYVFACFLRGWDDDAVRMFFADNYVQGAASGHALLREPGARRSGSSALGRAVRLLYVPDDPVGAPAMLAYRAVPDWDDNAELAFQRRDELGIPLLAELVRGASGKILEVGRVADLTL